MKYTYLFFIGLIFFSCRSGQVKTSDKNKIPQCVDLTFDIEDGTLSGIKPVQKQSEISEWFPCHTRMVPDGNSSDCGGALYYENHGFTFYTYLYEYLEIRKDFKGNVTHDLFSKNREEIRQLLGKPAENDLAAENPDMDFFPMEFGCMRIKYEGGKPVLIASHYLACDEIEWCR